MYECRFCERTLCTDFSRVQHEENNHIDEEESDCDICGGEFGRKSSMMQHKLRVHDVIHEEAYQCIYCDRDYDTKLQLVQHLEGFHGNLEESTCNRCNRWFPLRSSRMQHQRHCFDSDGDEDDDEDDDDDDENSFGDDIIESGSSDENDDSEGDNIEEYIRERLSRINVTLTDRKRSRLVVQRVLSALAVCVDYYGSIFSKQFRKSGSYSTDTKIYKADEFDYDVPLKYSLEKMHIIRQGDIYYELRRKQKTLNLNVPMIAIHTRDYTGIPNGYAEVQNTSGKIIIPRIIQEQMYIDLKCAADKFHYITLNKRAQGPAVTLVIRQPGSHNISVDFSPSIATNQVTLRDFNWPRAKTEKVLSRRLINDVFDAGLHLVPKKLKFWYISVSYAGTTLMNGMDVEDSGCRKSCHKLLKADFQTWLGRTKHELSEFSTMIFKHQVFWMNEENPGMDWSQENVAERYMDMLKDLSKRLRRGVIYNYFRDVENILKDKDQATLNRLANLAMSRRQEVLNMG